VDRIRAIAAAEKLALTENRLQEAVDFLVARLDDSLAASLYGSCAYG
jgi:hypothetical protein